MAIDVPTELLTASSGSVGLTIHSRNQHGQYTRARTTPTDPATTRQIVVRDALAECVTAWKTTLTETERQGWDAFALAVRTRTALGRSTNAGGLGMYIRANVPRIQAAVGGTPRVDQAPTIRTSPSMEPVTLAILNVVDDTCLLYVPAGQQWLNQVGGALLFYASPPQPLTVNYYKGPYRFAGKIVGQPLGPSVTPFTFTLPFPAAPGERVFVRVRQTRTDGRLGPSVRLQADHVPQLAPAPVAAVFFMPVPRRVEITFSEIIRPDPHSALPWTVRFASRQWTVGSVFGFGPPTPTIRLFLTASVPAPPLDRLFYAPPPSDVFGINTGIAVATFQIPIT